MGQDEYLNLNNYQICSSFAKKSSSLSQYNCCYMLFNDKQKKIQNSLLNLNLMLNPKNIYLLFLWCHQESNRGHKDFQSFALPTELWHHCFY